MKEQSAQQRVGWRGDTQWRWGKGEGRGEGVVLVCEFWQEVYTWYECEGKRD